MTRTDPSSSHPENADEFRKKMATIIYRAVESGESGWPANKELEVVDDIATVHQQSIAAERAKAREQLAEQLHDMPSTWAEDEKLMFEQHIHNALARKRRQEVSDGTVE
jgi:hypothetical protein